MFVNLIISFVLLGLLIVQPSLSIPTKIKFADLPKIIISDVIKPPVVVQSTNLNNQLQPQLQLQEKQLRGAPDSQQVETLAGQHVRDGTHVKIRGFWKQVYYAGNCETPKYKYLLALDACIPQSLDPNYPVYSIFSVEANAQTKQHTVYEQTFSNVDCTQSLTSRYAIFSPTPDLTCLPSSSGYEFRAHWSRTLPEPSLDTYAVGFIYYRTSTACHTGIWQDPAFVQYYKLSTCYYNVNGDFMYTGCTSNGGLVALVYGTSNGSCGGGALQSYVSSTDDSNCDNWQAYSNMMYGGYVRIQCEQESN